MEGLLSTSSLATLSCGLAKTKSPAVYAEFGKAVGLAKLAVMLALLSAELVNNPPALGAGPKLLVLTSLESMTV